MPRQSRDMVRVNLYLTRRQIEVLEKAAADRGLTFSEMTRRVLDAFAQKVQPAPADPPR